MLRQTLGVVRELPRLHEITSVFLRYGLGEFVQRIGLVGLLERAGHALQGGKGVAAARLAPAARMRLALTELGPTFIKLGQVMATRVDLLPPAWIAEFEKLHTQVPPVAFEAVRPELERALGRSPFDVFVELEAQSFAAASIAQVHRARLADGTPVVLKVRRPGVRDKIEADLRLLRHVAELIESEVPEARRYRPVEVAAQFARSLERELDFAAETRNIERFARNFAGDAHIVIPRVFPEWTSDVLLVQERVDGVPGTDPAALDAAGLDRRLLAARGVDAFLKMILIDGFFHADPHPGNVVYLPGNRIALLDFGMVGRLSPERREQIVALLGGLARRDETPMLEVLLDWAGDALVDEAKLAADLNELVFDYEGVPLRELRVDVALRQLAAILREHSIVLPADLALLFKALISLEGLGRAYDPEFRFTERLAPWVEQAVRRRYAPAELARRGRSALSDFLGLFAAVPRDLARLVRDARRGRARVDLDLKRLDHFGRQLDRTLDRVTVGILTASLVIGSAIVMTVREGPTVAGVNLLTAIGLLGYLAAFVNSLWILYGIWRAGKE